MRARRQTATAVTPKPKQPKECLSKAASARPLTARARKFEASVNSSKMLGPDGPALAESQRAPPGRRADDAGAESARPDRSLPAAVRRARCVGCRAPGTAGQRSAGAVVRKAITVSRNYRAARSSVTQDGDEQPPSSRWSSARRRDVARSGRMSTMRSRQRNGIQFGRGRIARVSSEVRPVSGRKEKPSTSRPAQRRSAVTDGVTSAQVARQRHRICRPAAYRGRRQDLPGRSPIHHRQTSTSAAGEARRAFAVVHGR